MESFKKTIIPLNSLPFEKEVNKYEELLSCDIDSTSTWFQRIRYCFNLSNSDIALFYHSRNFNKSEAEKLIFEYFVTRSIMPALYKNRSPRENKELADFLKREIIIPLDTPTYAGYKVILWKQLYSNPCDYNYEKSLKYFHMVLDLNIYEEGCQEGYIVVLDIAKITKHHLYQRFPWAMNNFISTIESSPIRWKGLHFVLSNIDISPRDMNIMKIFQSKIVQINADKMFFHMNQRNASFTAEVPLHILPDEFGGKAGALEELHSKQIKKIIDSSDWFLRKEVLENFSMCNINGH